jgi:hypothetical protein
MFPGLRQRFGVALELVVEFSTLGEYRMDAAGDHPAGALATAAGESGGLGGLGIPAERVPPKHRHTVAEGTTGRPPVATPAARRLQRAQPTRRGPGRAVALRSRRHRAGTPPVPDQPCLRARSA